MIKDFEKICSYLSGFNLENLVLASSLLSSMEYYNNWPDEYAYYVPVVNIVRSNMFTKALLYSDSSYLSQKKLDQSSFPLIINSLTQSADRYDIIEDPDLEPEDKIDQMIMSMFSSQIWYDRDITNEKMGLLYAQYHQIPQRFIGELNDRHGDHFIHIPNFIKNDIGIDIRKYLITCVYLLHHLYQNLYHDFLEPSEFEKARIKRAEGDEIAQNGLRQDLVTSKIYNATDFYSLYTFSKQPTLFSSHSLSSNLEFLDPDELDAFFQLTSRNIHELRQLNKQPHYQKGHISQRLTPFERFPILKLDTPCYTIPNLRFFELGYTELIRFALQHSFEENNQFHEVMGSVQEYLIVELLNQLENENFIIVPERAYNKNNTEYKGPDVIVIDHGRPILIESKAKQLLLDTRLKPSGETLDNNLEVVTSALAELDNHKYSDLYQEEIYDDIRGNLKDRGNVQPLFVGVMAEGVIAMQEQVTKLKNNNPDHPLNGIEHPCIFIDVFNLYRAIEICKTHDLSLYTILKKYWTVGSDLSPKQNASDSFEGLKYDLKTSFSAAKVKQMIGGLFDE